MPEHETMKFELKDPHFLPHSGCEVSFEVGPGHALVLVGENGIGKTTLLNRFSLDLPFPKVIVEQRALDFFYDRTVKEFKETLFFSRQISRENFNHLWDLFGLKNKEERRLSSLSGGEGQALKLCASLVADSEIYFLDEPSQFLDDGKKRALALVLESLKEKNKIILMIEHDLDWCPKGWQVQELIIQNQKIILGRKWTT